MSKFAIALLFIAVSSIQACTTPPHELKSPCVGASASPCDRRAVNNDLS